jgi:hypothetical protein
MAPEIQKKNITKIELAIIIVILLCMGAYFYSRHKTPVQPVVGGPSNNSIKQIPGGKLPPALPKDIVLAKDAKIISSYTAMRTDNKEQSTLIYSTASTTLFTSYITYLARNQWSILTGIATAAPTTAQASTSPANQIQAKKGDQIISINFSFDPKNHQTITSINLTNIQNKQ